MICPNHPQAEATGYCAICGDFGCPECLTLHEGNLLCMRHYRPIARKIEEETARKKHMRQRLVVRYLDGRREIGISFALNLKEAGFHLQLVDSSGAALEKSVFVLFADLKAVFLAKSFDGIFDKTVRYKEWTPQGNEMVIQFKDGEILRGASLQRFDPREPRFHLIPADLTTNNISVLVEMSAVEKVYSPEEYKAKEASEQEARAAIPAAPPSQEETTGDFYFETRNYSAALEQYKLAEAKYPPSRRLYKKLFVALFNVGLHHIKRHEYDKALFYMESSLKMDPQNERIKKKVGQLRHIIDKTASRGARPQSHEEMEL